MTSNVGCKSKRATDLDSGHLRSPSTKMETSSSISLHGIVHICLTAIVTEKGFKHSGAIFTPFLL